MKEEIKNENIDSEECECNDNSCCCDEHTCDDTCKCHNADNNDCHCLEDENSDLEKDQSCNSKENCECDKKSKKEKKDKHGEKCKELEKRILELEVQNKELSDQSLRSHAELINYRKRKDEEVSKMLKYASEDIVKELLQVVDNFERAINMDDDNLEDEVSKFLSGFKMIYCKFVSILEKNGVKAIDGANKPFDPTYHQAVLTEARDGVEAGMILEVLQKGYLLKDKVIRPAMVKVSE